MTVDPELVRYVRQAPDGLSAGALARWVAEHMGREVTAQEVLRAKNPSLARNQKVEASRDEAADRLSDSLNLADRSINTLEDIFIDTDLPIGDRVKASAELRQWTKMVVDQASGGQRNVQNIFVVSPAWSINPPQEEIVEVEVVEH